MSVPPPTSAASRHGDVNLLSVQVRSVLQVELVTQLGKAFSSLESVLCKYWTPGLHCAFVV